jgi:prepilin-type N-terminal cleavage/methylation domain-containing protein
MFIRSNLHKAFTLAELLIVVGILGLIATFALPKVVANIGESQIKSILKTNVASVNAILYAEWVEKGNTMSIQTALLRDLEYEIRCDANIVAGDCSVAYWTQSTPRTDRIRLILKDGSIVWPYLASGSTQNRIGIKALKTADADVTTNALELRFAPTDFAGHTTYPQAKAGELKAMIPSSTLYGSLFN